MYRKRERTQNWSLEEKKYLLELVKARLNVLENKRIDSASSAMKGMAWQDIHAAFAARFGNDRDAHRVREQWRRMKGQARTEMMEFADRVRNFGADVANQRWPSTLSEDVWKTLESARKLNEFQQGYGGADDVNSPVTMMDDDEEDGDDGFDPDRSGAGVAESDFVARRLLENGIKMEPADVGDRYDRLNQDHRDDREDGREYEPEVLMRGSAMGHQDDVREDANHVHPGLMSMLRPKVELNDVPEVDTSMVPSGLSITAVKIAGGGGHKRRLLDRQEIPVRTSPWNSPGPGHNVFRDHHAVSGGVAAARSTTPQASPAPQQGVNSNGHPATFQESKRLELRRRLEMMEEEHGAKMQLLRVEKETAEIRRRIASKGETDAASAFTCRSCGGGRSAGGDEGHRLHAVKRRASSSKNEVEDVDDVDLGGDVGSAATSTAAGPSSPASTASRDGSDPGDPGEPLRDAIVNGVGLKGEDDTSETDPNQVRFAGGLGEPGSGAGKGGGSGGSIRDAGGSMGKREAAFEEEYFYKQQKEQLKKLKSDLADEIGFHEEQIKRHQEAIARHKQRVSDLDKDK